MNLLLEFILFILTATLFIVNYSGITLGFLNSMWLFLGLSFYILWIIARVQLGKYFSVTPKAKGLMTKGLYSKFSNPIYLFSSLSLFFAMLPSHNILQYSILVIVIIIQMVRSRKEASLLEKRFGKKYLIYKSKTWF
jgi:protein-S-isoprenylcysteine O-methyltransferase Ste14